MSVEFDHFHALSPLSTPPYFCPSLATVPSSDLSVIAPVAQQGAGQINADAFVRSKIELSPNRLELNHTGANALRTRFNIDITNHGSEPVTFKASHLPALTSYAFDSGPAGGITYPLPETMDDKRAEVILASESITVRPGATAVLRFRILPPTGFKEPERLPSFGGYIALEGSNGEKLYVPYAGIAIDGKTIDPFGPGDLTWLRSSTSQPITEETTVTLAQGDGIYTVSETRWGYAVWRTDVIEADYPVPRLQSPGVPGRTGLVGTVDEQHWVGRDIYGMTTRTNLPNQFPNGTAIPSGRYRYVTRALRPFWSEGERGAWEVRTSPVINVVRGASK
jgi:hypothetical protein